LSELGGLLRSSLQARLLLQVHFVRNLHVSEVVPVAMLRLGVVHVLLGRLDVAVQGSLRVVEVDGVFALGRIGVPGFALDRVAGRVRLLVDIVLNLEGSSVLSRLLGLLFGDDLLLRKGLLLVFFLLGAGQLSRGRREHPFAIIILIRVPAGEGGLSLSERSSWVNRLRTGEVGVNSIVLHGLKFRNDLSGSLELGAAHRSASWIALSRLSDIRFSCQVSSGSWHLELVSFGVDLGSPRVSDLGSSVGLALFRVSDILVLSEVRHEVVTRPSWLGGSSGNKLSALIGVAGWIALDMDLVLSLKGFLRQVPGTMDSFLVVEVLDGVLDIMVHAMVMIMHRRVLLLLLRVDVPGSVLLFHVASMLQGRGYVLVHSEVGHEVVFGVLVFLSRLVVSGGVGFALH